MAALFTPNSQNTEQKLSQECLCLCVCVQFSLWLKKQGVPVMESIKDDSKLIYSSFNLTGQLTY